MKQLIGSSFVIAALATALSFACSQPSADEATGSSDDKIVGGTEATPGAWPGAVAMYRGTQQVCGGTLVAPNWVVSAGHCVISPGQPTGGLTKIVAGRHNLKQVSGEAGPIGEDLQIKRVIRHPNYNSSNQDNDISIWELVAPSTSPTAKLVPADQASAVAADAVTTVVGWGTTSESGRPSDVLLQVDVPVISNDKCKTFPRYNTVTENMICAGYLQGGRDSCQGDSGGPLFQKINGEYYHVGLTSWGIGCARANAPGVYTRTSKYLDWMKTTSGGVIGATTPTNSDAGTDAGPAFSINESGSVKNDEEKAFTYEAPAGTYSIDLAGDNDADLYVKVGEAVSFSTFDCRPFIDGSAEHCSVTLAKAGKINVMVRGQARNPSTFTLTGAVAAPQE